MHWDDDLDPDGVHYKIASSNHPRIGVLAGPGTGKTRYALMRRVARLLEQGEAEPEQILLVTFTRTAANDLVQKLEDLQIPGVDRVAGGTLHGFCLGLLQRDAVLQVHQRTVRMLLEHETDLMLRDLQGAFGSLGDRQEMLMAFQAGWARALTDHPGVAVDAADQSFEAQVVRWLRHHRAMLVGEVVPLALMYLRNNPAADERTRFRHVIVDEYQDLNLLEQRLIDLLVPPGGAICVVGDDDQSIYRFRYAHPEGIVTFVTAAGTERREINECGRCPEPVLAIANTLMHSAPDRAKPDLTCGQPTPGRVAVVQWENLDAEVEGLSGFIASEVEAERREAGDFIVLVNRREIGYRIRTRLDALGIHARSFFVDNALEKSANAQVSLAVLRLHVARTDRVALRVWLGAGDSAGRSEAYGRLRKAAEALGLGEYEALDRANRGEIHLQAIALKRRMHDLQDRLATLDGMSLQDLIDELFGEESDDVRGIRQIARDLLETVDLPRALLDGLVRGITQPEIPQRPDFVRVMSLHKSKGLTSAVVIVGAALNGIIPTIKNKWTEDEQQRGYDEGRRLFYVAVTRSSDELLISSAKRMPWAEARQLGVRYGAAHDRDGVLIVECLSTPYLAECGAALPVPLYGPAWLAGRA